MRLQPPPDFPLRLSHDHGVQGIALATAISVTLGSLLNLRHLRPLMPAFRRLSWAVVKNISAIGWPMGLLQILWQFGSVALFLILSMLPSTAWRSSRPLRQG